MQNAQHRTGCVVTGAAGFVGSHLAERLLSLGHRVVGVDNFFSGHRENMASFIDHPGFGFHERSITEPRLLSDLKAKYPDLTRCFHLAAVVSVPYSMEHPEETMDVNYHAVANLVEEAREMNFESFIFAGSAAEYGDDQRLPLREEYATEETRHLSPYGRAKYLASKKVGSAAGGVALRFFNIYGPRQDPRSPYSGVISRFTDFALSMEPLTILGDGLQTRDFIYVSDVVDVYLHAAGLEGSTPAVPAGIYNIGNGTAISVLDLAEAIMSLTANEKPPVFLPERPGDIRHSLASVESFRAAADWSPKITLREGLQRTIEWARRTTSSTS